MLATERHARILSLVASRQVASTEELATTLGVSAETIRRDIRVLDERGQLHRVRGGAASASVAVGEPRVEERQLLHHAEKEVIGRLAADLLQDGQTVVLDLGTTAMEVARAMIPRFRGVVATNSMLVAGELAGHPNIDVLVCGGRVRAGDLALSSAISVDFFAGLNADVALVSSGGVDATRGLTDFHLDEIATRREMIRQARRAYVLADSSKFGAVAPHFVADFGPGLGLVTDRNPGGELARELHTKGGALICP